MSSSPQPFTAFPELGGLPYADLQLFFEQMGEKRYRANQVMKWIHQKRAVSFAEMTDLPKTLRERLENEAYITVPRVEAAANSADGVKKFLMAMPDGEHIETVLIPSEGYDTLCVSTQVGCAMGCRICRTGALGFRRNLSAGEIVAQLNEVRRQEPERNITNVVFMGMGEPLANFDNTVAAIQILTHPSGPQISWRRLTLSTVGLPDKIIQLGQHVRVKLAVSLNAVSNEQRSRIMPINRKHSLEELIAALQKFPLPRGMRITIEYVLIHDFNDSDADARRLVKLLSHVKAKVNLIPFNDELSQEFRSPTPERVASFQNILLSKSLTAIVRKSRGRDILAACGQLAGLARDAAA
ncbi:MAG: 23S rRNA (adenine(2503)-C(2))-methyltransferase RlmN [Desulfomonilaceae bacterium]